MTSPHRLLEGVLKYLLELGQISEKEANSIILEVNEDCDRNNQKDPRAFCRTMRGSPVIQTTRALTSLPDHFIVGILLHEVGHIATDSFDGDESEVDVDEWALGMIPSYDYGECVYLSPWTQEKVEAYALECVAEEVVDQLLRNLD